MAAGLTRHSRYDVVIVGSRVAGASTALLLARAGLSVLTVDRASYGSDTLSTHAILRGGVLQLHRWGVLDAIRAAGTPAVRTTTFHYGDEAIEIPIKPDDGIDALYAPRRRVLDRALADAASAAGAEMVFGARVTDLVRNHAHRVSGVVLEDRAGRRSVVEARFVVGADGTQSTVARLAGAPTLVERRHATGVIYGYVPTPALTGYHWFFRPGVSAGLIETNDRLSCLFVSTSSARFWNEMRRDLRAGFDRVLEETSPRLAEAVRAAGPIDRLRGFPGYPSFLRQSWGPGWALVGDAGYFKDPVTAHGITDGLRDAELLADAIVDGRDEALARYQATRDDLSLELMRVTDAIASFDWTFETLAGLHRDLSAAMKREVTHLRALGDNEAVSA